MQNIEQQNDEEQQLTEQLNENQSQLDVILQQLHNEPDNEELLELRSSLEELVNLLEGELVTIKKAKLLAQLESGEPFDSGPSDCYDLTVTDEVRECEQAACDISANCEQQNQEEQAIKELVDQFDGLQCSVPFRAINGCIDYHDAILKVDLDEETASQLLNTDDVHLKAFFLYPLSEDMLTCPYYLQNCCRFSSHNDSSNVNSITRCRYSHGHTVSVHQVRVKRTSELVDTLPKDTSLKQLCLVRNSTLALDSKLSNRNLWSKATILKTVAEQSVHKILVQLFISQLEHWISVSAESEDLVLIDQSETDTSESSEQSFESVEASYEPNVLLNSNANTSLDSVEFGEWQRYTTGIGSKLMAKMGYQPGTGLGSSGQGRIHPVNVIVYPDGKSLDTCLAIKQESDRRKMDIKFILKERAHKLRIEQKHAKDYDRETRRNIISEEGGSVFAFLNKRILADKSHQNSASRKINQKDCTESNQSKHNASIKQMDFKSLNLTSFKVDEELKKAEIELNKLRNIKNNSKTTAIEMDHSVQHHLNEKLDKMQAKVDSLKRRQSEISKEQKHRSNRDKLKFF